MSVVLNMDVREWLDESLTLVRIEGHHKVILRCKPMEMSVRGHLLLETEKMLRRQVDQSIEVYLEPKGDVNKLRTKLRGVKL